MPIQGGIENPQGAFGYATTGSGTPIGGAGPFHLQRVARFRNASTAVAIQAGAAVVLSCSTLDGWGSTVAGVLTATTADDAVFASTVIGHPGVIGIARTAAATRTTATTFGAGNAPSSEYCDVVLEGPFYGALVSSGTTGNVAGRWLINSNDTAVEGSTISGGVLTLLDTANVTTAVGVNQVVGAVGIQMTAGTTGTTGFLTTVGNRALVWVRPNVFINRVAIA